ncbi:MAG: putative protein conserved in bacteria (DUF2125) [Rhodobacteraceae bacterium HLUCCA12]|nr:MAG: putative protein conserved in bacteria (DUF2125) [Rhodobacteraceae bacterium HLUCCA12]
MRVIWALVTVAVLAVIGWGGYWFMGARSLDRTVERILAVNPAVDAADHRIAGFPNRFDLTVTEPRLERDGVRWSAPFIQFFALSYRLNHLIAVFPHDQQIGLGTHELTLHSTDMRASVVMEPSLDLPLARFALVAQEPALRSGGETHRADEARLASRARDTYRHQVAIEIENARADTTAMDRLDPQGHWPRAFANIGLDAELVFDRPLDRHALTGPPPGLAGFTLTGATLEFDTIRMIGEGRLTPDANGFLSGEMTLTVTNWRDLMRRARDAGLMPAEHDTLITLGLESMTDPDNPDRLQAPLVLRDGDVLVGPVVLGTVPPLF